MSNRKEPGEKHCLWSSDYYIMSWHSDFNLKIDILVANLTKFIVERLFCYCFLVVWFLNTVVVWLEICLICFFPWGLALPELRGKELKYRKESNLLVVQMLTVQQSALIFSSLQHVVEAWKVYRCIALKNLATERGTSTLLFFNGLVELTCT